MPRPASEIAAASQASALRAFARKNAAATLPDETERYVLAVTGVAAAEWKASSAKDVEPTAKGCEEVLASITTVLCLAMPFIKVYREIDHPLDAARAAAEARAYSP